MNYTVISVESRKGGVGKTTAALNLCDILTELGYKTLLIDLDITGTSINGASSSIYWKDKIHIIEKSRKQMNVLELFHGFYITGKTLPNFTINPNESDSLFLVKNKINVFFSQIYNDDKSIICDPRIMFDELHSFWFIEMLIEICDNFVKPFGVQDKKIIVLDNSPGFIGLGKAIQNWLTDIGPIFGKFLTISSLDIQDLQSCIQAIIGINQNLQSKIEAAKYLFSLRREEVNNKIELTNSEQKNFFSNLTLNLNSTEKYKFYLDEDYRKNINLNYYQGLIINKAPSLIKPKTFYYDLIEGLNRSEEEIKVLDHFTGDIIDRSPKNVVYYDEKIQFQFFESFIKLTEAKIHAPLKRYFTILQKEIENTEELTINNYYYLLDLTDKLDRKLRNLIKLLLNYGFENIVHLIDEKWYPISPLINLKKSFLQFTKEPTFPLKKVSKRDYNYLDQLLQKNEDFHLFPLYDNEEIRNSFSTLSLYLIQSSNFSESFEYILMSIIKVQRDRYTNFSHGYQHFLAIENLTEKQIVKYYPES